MLNALKIIMLAKSSAYSKQNIPKCFYALKMLKNATILGNYQFFSKEKSKIYLRDVVTVVTLFNK